MHFTIGKHNFSHNVVILDGLRTDFIVGADLMRQEKYVIDMSSSSIRRTASVPTHLNGKIQVKCPRQFTLEPLSIAMVEVSVKGTNGELYIASGQHVPEGLCKQDNYGKSKIIVANRTLQPIKMNRGELICTMEKTNPQALAISSKQALRARRKTTRQMSRMTSSASLESWRHPANATSGMKTLNVSTVNAAPFSNQTGLRNNGPATPKDQYARNAMMGRDHAMTASTSTNVYPDCSTGAATLKQREIGMKGYQGPWSWVGRPIYSVTNMIMNGMRKKEVCEVNNTVNGNIVDVKNYLTDEVVNKALINIPAENKGTFAKLLRKFQDVFSKTDEDIGH